MLDYKILGQKIKAVRTNSGYTQEQASAIAQISADHWSHIETCATKLSLPALVSIANALKVSVDFLLSDSLYESKAYFSDEVSKVFSDANSNEMYVMLQSASAIKQSMRIRKLSDKSE